MNVDLKLRMWLALYKSLTNESRVTHMAYKTTINQRRYSGSDRAKIPPRLDSPLPLQEGATLALASHHTLSEVNIRSTEYGVSLLKNATFITTGESGSHFGLTLSIPISNYLLRILLYLFRTLQCTSRLFTSEILSEMS